MKIVYFLFIALFFNVTHAEELQTHWWQSEHYDISSDNYNQWLDDILPKTYECIILDVDSEICARIRGLYAEKDKIGSICGKPILEVYDIDGNLRYQDLNDPTICAQFKHYYFKLVKSIYLQINE